MKMFKRFAAVLLAGVMVLAMLTACGSSSNETESKLLGAINTATGSAYSNNADLQAKVRATLSKVDENGLIKVADLPVAELEGQKMSGFSDADYNKDTGDLSIVIYVVGEDTSDHTAIVASEVTDELLKKTESVQPGAFNFEDVVHKGKVDAIGIATYTASNGKTYFGYAFKVSGNVYDIING